MPSRRNIEVIQRVRRLPDIWFFGAMLAVLVSLGHFVTGPLTGDDDYVIHNLASPGLGDILFAYNVDLVQGEGGQTTWYEGFEPLQRRYVRIVPSALMAIEYRMFGSRAVPLKSVSLFIHLLTLVLAYRLLRRHLADPRTAALIVALVGLHPSAAECVGWFACQPILFSGLASIAAADALLMLREHVTVGRRVTFAAAAAVALFSYEAAVAVPLLLTAGWRRLGIATSHAPERRGETVAGFRLTLDRPLASYAFITAASSCVTAVAMTFRVP